MFEPKIVVSYATRPMRDNETNGVEHWFISEEQADKLLENKDNIIAYTEINGYRYFTTKDIFDKSNIYIIDPMGIKYLRYRHPEIKIKEIYVFATKSVRRNNTSNRSDNNSIFEDRSKDENGQFLNYENGESWDFFFDNSAKKDTDDKLEKLKSFIDDTYKDTDIYCFIGRTGAGKDYIINRLIELYKY